jgi:hypothetical protein
MSEQLSLIAVPPPMPPASVVRREIQRAERVAKAAKAKAKLSADEESFETFWLAYAKRPNNPKQLAKASWNRALKTATAEEIMVGLAKYEFSPDPKFRPMAATFLNQRRWACVNESLDDDPFGLMAWHATITSDGTLSAAMYDPHDLRPILIATGWEPSWRGSLDVLGVWMRDGFVPDSVAKTIAAAVAEFGARGNLAAFDKRVRYRAERISQ